MKRHFLTSALLCLALSPALGNSPDPVSAAASLQSVIVYRSGAELTHSVSALLPAGPVTLAVDDVSVSLDLNTVRVGLPSTITLLGIAYQDDFLSSPPKSARQRLLEDSLERLQEARSTVRLSLTNTINLLRVLNKNQELKGTQTGVNVDELRKFMDYYGTESGALTEQQFRLERKDSVLMDIMGRVRQQINEETTKNSRVAGRLILELLVANAGDYNFSVSYLSAMAGWSPQYDLEAGNWKDSIQIAYKASVEQSTGLDWKQVRLSLSTSYPLEWNQAPVLAPAYLSIAPRPELRDVVLADKLKMLPGVPVESKSFQVEGNLGDADSTSIVLAQADTRRLNIVYRINLPCDLASDGASQALTLQTERVPTVFTYFAVPKLSDQVYLLADVPDWGNLELLPGTARIVVDGTYVGTTTIDPTSTGDTLHLTLGSDPRVAIQRRQVTDLASEKFLSGNQYQHCAYAISVKNNRGEGIHLRLEDQIPVATNKDIEVTPGDLGTATLNAAEGELDWSLDLKPGESRELRFDYSLKYPKGQRVETR